MIQHSCNLSGYPAHILPFNLKGLVAKPFRFSYPQPYAQPEWQEYFQPNRYQPCRLTAT
ncbi:MAG: hypothetical protein K8R86_05380 [Bacteroidales bacterium]|nr:hypothetical protein [Bacteroidales bacterium]